MRYHPAVVAQKAATTALLSGNRFTLGLGSGESLNEHTVGRGWPALQTRHEMLLEAVEIIRRLHSGDLLTYRGEHFSVDSSRIWDLPDLDRIVDSVRPFADAGFTDLALVQVGDECQQRFHDEAAEPLL